MAHLTEEIQVERKWHIFAALGTGIFLASLDGSIVNVVLPTLVRDLRVDFTLVQWVVLSFTLTQTAVMLSVGRLGDMVGKRPIFLGGTVAFLISSILAGFAPNIEILLFLRVVQAVGGAFATALSMGIVTETFPSSEHGKALGLFSATVSVGGIAGPLLGGLLLDVLSWRWIFFVGLPFSVSSYLLAWRYFPRARPQGSQEFDWTGAMLLFVGLLTVMLFLSFGQRAGYLTPAMLSLFVVSLVAFALFVHSQLRTSEPLLDISLFRNPQFSLSLATRLISFVVIGGVTILFPFYLTNLIGLDPIAVGMLLTVTWASFGLASPFSGILSDRYGFRSIAAAGLVVLGFGCYTVSTLGSDSSVVGIVLRVLPMGLGMGIFQSPNNSAVLGSVSRGRLGVVSGLNVVGRTLGYTVGIAALGALWSGRVSVYAGSGFAGDVTEASAAAQMTALRDVAFAALGLVVLGLALSAWELHLSRAAAPAAASSR